MTVPVRGHESPDGTLTVFPGPRCLAHNHVDGPLIETGGVHPGPTYRSNLPPIVAPRAPVRDQLSARAERLAEKNPTKPGLPTPDNVTCYLHELNGEKVGHRYRQLRLKPPCD